MTLYDCNLLPIFNVINKFVHIIFILSKFLCVESRS